MKDIFAFFDGAYEKGKREDETEIINTSEDERIKKEEKNLRDKKDEKMKKKRGIKEMIKF